MTLLCGLTWVLGLPSVSGGAQPVAWLPAALLREGARPVLRSQEGVEVAFERQSEGWRWTAYRDTVAGREWRIEGPYFSVQTPDGKRTNLGEIGLASLTEATSAGGPSLVLEAQLATPPVAVRQTFAFCSDRRTLRISSALRSLAEPIVIQRVGLLEVRVVGQALTLMGPGHVSSPVFGDRVFAGVEHPAALCQVDGDTLCLAQHSYTRVGADWVSLPPAVFGSASEGDVAQFGGEAMRHAFLRYLDTVRIRPADIHIHYNNWWTMPVPFTEADVLANLAELKRGLYDRTGFFFDSYAMDLGWSDVHSVWEVNRAHYPRGFDTIRETLAEMGSRPGLWVSPSSLYSGALDNEWLEAAGYETTPRPPSGRFACLALGGKYQQAFRAAVLKHAREANLGHVKFDGLAWPCDVPAHGHPIGIESFQPIAEGLMDVFDSLRAQDPGIALEPTCLGYYPSPWWLMHTPFVIGPFGDDSPHGRVPCPEWIESMTTARDCAILAGRDAFLMPSSALECFDIIVQCPGDFENHAAMAIGRGHWFLSTYINPRFMDAGEWRFFADLVRWARANRDFLQDPLPIGGAPAERKPYGYAYRDADRELLFVRNPWIEEASLSLPESPDSPAREMRTLYPRREVLARTPPGGALPPVRLGPYELLVVEVVPASRPAQPLAEDETAQATWRATRGPAFERVVFEDDPPAYGPSWTAVDGDVAAVTTFSGRGVLTTDADAELCLLAEGDPSVAFARCELEIDGRSTAAHSSRSMGAFSAQGAPAPEHWIWFTAPLAAGRHAVGFRLVLGDQPVRCGAFVRGLAPCEAQTPFLPPKPRFPLYRPNQRPWSRVLASLAQCDPATAPSRRAPRETVTIDGIYLDTLDWVEATAGWGEVQRNRSVMGNMMMMAGRTFRRGLGTHAVSRIVYDVPPGYRRFAATIGCDREVYSDSVVFVVQGDGRELFRSPLMRREGSLIEVAVGLKGVKRLDLIVEDGGNGIIADHANWADARLLR
jgi:hypothetical protein